MLSLFSQYGTLVKLGLLADVLEGLGTTLHVMEFSQMDSIRYKIAATVIMQTPSKILKQSEGFIIPTLSPFDSSPLMALMGSDFKLRKVLIATTQYTESTDMEKSHEMGSSHFAKRFSNALPTLSGCAQLLPLSDAEKLICDVNGILYE